MHATLVPEDTTRPGVDSWGRGVNDEGGDGQKYAGRAEEDHGRTWLALTRQYQLTGPRLRRDWTAPQHAVDAGLPLAQPN